VQALADILVVKPATEQVVMYVYEFEVILFVVDYPRPDETSKQSNQLIIMVEETDYLLSLGPC
jgi:hypothetical protein